MANEHKIEINKRDDTSKKGIKHLRREGNIPGIYYSSTSKASTLFYVTQGEYQNAVKSGARIFNIFVDGKKQNVLFKSVQYHPVTDRVMHIDLYGVKMDEAVTVKVPVQLIGDPLGVKEEGGVLNQAFSEIEIQVLDFIEMRHQMVFQHGHLNIQKICSLDSMDIVLEIYQNLKMTCEF